jgi:regulator of nonsense transcripts 2
VIKQRGLLRIVGELELVGVLRKENGKGSTGDVTWVALKELVSLFFSHVRGVAKLMKPYFNS